MAISEADGTQELLRIDRPMGWRAAAFPYLMFAPAFLLIAAVSFIPIAYAIVQSFFRSNTLALGRFVGLDNYRDFLFTLDGVATLEHSLIFVAGTVLIAVPFGFALALLLNRPLPLRGLLRTILITPWLVSNLVGALLWAWIGNPQYGLVPYLLEWLGLSMPNIITDPGAAMASVIVASVWASTPLVMVFVLAALQSVPGDLTEAARIDGASVWRRFRKITLPLVRNTTMMAVVLTSLHAFKSVEIILVMTSGGPNGATETMATKVFHEAFTLLRIGVGSAGAVMIFLLNLMFTMAFVRVLRTEHGA
ncbi:MAG TPA: sugar ABC transporter permease [Pseudolabrys sp.]|nr:sugar ABC transporter permease [Pseudolabrys sp.]